MTRTLNSLLIAASLFAFAPAAFADFKVQVTAEFPHDTALTAEENYQNMLVTAENACDVLQPSGVTFPANRAAETRLECEAELVEQAVQAFQRPDLAAVHYAVTGKQIQSAELPR